VSALIEDDRKSSSASRDAAAGVFVQAGACALSFDVEEYFQVWSLAERAPRREWAHWPSRVEASTESLLEILAEHSVTATFFTLGCVAERHPQLIRRIVACGHELASHGYSHELAYMH
jgi:peptidoglycan/xylan/chitin deacetylase (PgdA/CDA1 family)